MPRETIGQQPLTGGRDFDLYGGIMTKYKRYGGETNLYRQGEEVYDNDYAYPDSGWPIRNVEGIVEGPDAYYIYGSTDIGEIDLGSFRYIILRFDKRTFVGTHYNSTYYKGDAENTYDGILGGLAYLPNSNRVILSYKFRNQQDSYVGQPDYIESRTDIYDADNLDEVGSNDNGSYSTDNPEPSAAWAQFEVDEDTDDVYAIQAYVGGGPVGTESPGTLFKFNGPPSRESNAVWSYNWDSSGNYHPFAWDQHYKRAYLPGVGDLTAVDADGNVVWQNTGAFDGNNGQAIALDENRRLIFVYYLNSSLERVISVYNYADEPDSPIQPGELVWEYAVGEYTGQEDVRWLEFDENDRAVYVTVRNGDEWYLASSTLANGVVSDNFVYGGYTVSPREMIFGKPVLKTEDSAVLGALDILRVVSA